MLYFQWISSSRWHALSNLGQITTDSISLRALFVEKIFTFSCVPCLVVIWLPAIGSSFPKRIPFVFPPFFVCVPPSLQSSNRHNESFPRFLNLFLVFQHEGGRAATEYWRRSWSIFFPFSWRKTNSYVRTYGDVLKRDSSPKSESSSFFCSPLRWWEAMDSMQPPQKKNTTCRLHTLKHIEGARKREKPNQ